LVAASTGQTPDHLFRAIEQNQLKAVYLFFGEEGFLIDEAVVRLERALITEGMRDFNYNGFSAQEASVENIRDAVETLPMMASARLVVVKDVHEFSEKEWEQLDPVLTNPVESCVLVCTSLKVDKRKRYFKRFSENGGVIEFKRPFDNQIPGWIVALAKRSGLEISSEAVATLHEMVGSQLSDLDSELKKLASFIGARRRIEESDVLAAVSRTRLENVFDLTDAIGANDRARALVTLAGLLDHESNEVGLLALITRHVRILQSVQQGLREGLSGQKLAARAGVSPYFLKQYVEQSRLWSEQKTKRTFQALLETDRALKSSPVSAAIWLENFVVHTCEGSGSSSQA